MTRRFGPAPAARVACVALLAARIAGCHPQPPVEAPPALRTFCSEEATPARIERLAPGVLTETIERVRHDLSDASGMSLVLFDRDRVLFELHTGFSHSELRYPVNSETAFYIASSTKSLVATTALLLEEEGLLDLDTPLSRYLPTLHFRGWFLSEDTITPRHLLTHDTGITSKALELRTSMTGEWDRETLLRLYGSAGGGLSKPRYSNLNYVLLGMVLEEVTGQTWQELLQQRLLDPLAMRRSFTHWERPADNIAHPHMLAADGSILPVPERQNLLRDNTLFPSGGVIASARDLATYVQLYLNCGKAGGVRLLPEATIRNAIAPHTRNSGGGLHEYFGFGFGWELALHDTLTLVAHGGSNRVGARSYIAFSPSLGIGLVILSNENTVTPYVQGAIARFVWDSLTEAPAAERLDETLIRWKEKVEARFADRIDGRFLPVFEYPNDPFLQPPLSAFAGSYADARYGTVHVGVASDGLEIRYGNYVTSRVQRLTSTRFVGDFGTNADPIRFHVQGSQVVALDFTGIGISFERAR
ncbi:MAG: penicillin-binding protein [Gemmatimonadota bacterium]|nr:MAG: penicillin-binding protein [Gemmatimonadota bacterium]